MRVQTTTVRYVGSQKLSEFAKAKSPKVFRICFPKQDILRTYISCFYIEVDAKCPKKYLRNHLVFCEIMIYVLLPKYV